MNFNVVKAIFRRNFVSYFSNPTGYVFICVFVMATSFAAFWPADFFNANLCNLDQLNRYLPYILIGFIPAITMSIWADERRQGTDELLLTIPAGDFDVVFGKYLAAVAIYTVALLFSLASNLAVLWTLGEPDIGLIGGTYFGYWVVGLAMLGVGMVASFLTGNLTVAFVLGSVFIAPMVFAHSADLATPSGWVGWAMERLDIDPATIGTFIKQWSVSEQFRDFSRGVISLSGLGYFLGIVAVTLYLSMVLIGRRHWKGGREGQGSRVHYFIRVVALIALVLGANMVLARHDSLRVDVTSERLSSLSPETRKLLTNLETKYPVRIDAYVSPTVPEAYAQTRLNLMSALREFQAVAGDKMKVTTHDTEPFSADATRAEQLYGIKGQIVSTQSRGAMTQEEVFLGVAVNCGTEKVIIPFFDKGLPAEYELIRSIATVSQQKRKKLGVVTTDAKLYGGFDMSSMGQTPSQMIINELEKQYEVVQVDPSSPIADTYDALLAVQPSSLGPEQLNNFITAVQSGIPTAIFEDPFPFPSFFPDVPGTDAPKQAAGGMNPFQQRQPPQPKGDVTKLWDLLGVDFDGADVVWQDYNPYPKFGTIFSREWVFVDAGSRAKEPFNEQQQITSGLQQLLLIYPGGVRGKNASSLKFTPLVTTSQDTGIVPADKIIERSFMGSRMNDLTLFRKETSEKYVLAAQITGKPQSNVPKKMADQEAEPAAKAEEKPTEATETPAATSEENAEPKVPEAPADPTAEKTDAKKPDAEKSPAKPARNGEMNVVLVCDIDCLCSAFFAVRARGSDDEGGDANFDFDNVTFVLNTLDFLSGDNRFIEIRKRRMAHRTLSKVNEATQGARDQASKAEEEFRRDFDMAKDKAQKGFDEEIKNLQKRLGKNNVSREELAMTLALAQQNGQQRLDIEVKKLEDRRSKELNSIKKNLALQVNEVQGRYKAWAVLLPPIPPLIVGLYVFFNRRAKEREGVSKTRLR